MAMAGRHADGGPSDEFVDAVDALLAAPEPPGVKKMVRMLLKKGFAEGACVHCQLRLKTTRHLLLGTLTWPVFCCVPCAALLSGNHLPILHDLRFSLAASHVFLFWLNVLPVL